MLSSSALFMVVAAIALFIPSGESIRCWVCSSNLDPRCGDTFNTTVPMGHHGYTLTDCNSQSTGGSYPYVSAARYVCKKSKQIVRGDMMIIRSCMWLLPEQPIGTCPESSSDGQIRVTFCETCETDGCNSGHSLAAFSILATLAAPIILLISLNSH